MHVIAGTLKGMSLSIPKNRAFRPTQGRVKEALFSLLSPYLEGARFLDLCCGTGANGLEAYSRGASRVVMVDTDVSVAKSNFSLAQSRVPELSASVSLVKQDGVKYLRSCGESFDLIFFDPPWDKAGLYADSLNAISGFGILEPTGILVCEHPKKFILPEAPALTHLKTYPYGDTLLTVFHKKPTQ